MRKENRIFRQKNKLMTLENAWAGWGKSSYENRKLDWVRKIIDDPNRGFSAE